MYPKFSVVIPTLGGEALLRTINLINSGSLVPDEVLICIPKELTLNVTELSAIQNVKVIGTESKGQVRQRIEGFKKVSNDYIVQLDDDMYVYETCLERLIEGLARFKEEVAITPAMIFNTTKQSCYVFEYGNSVTNTFIHGKEWFTPGNITRTGSNIGMNALLATQRYSAVNWLPGGCVAHKKQNLILYNFYPFEGKAFYEDVIQSIHLSKKNIKLLIDNTAICGIDEYEAVPFSLLSIAKSFNKHFRYRKHIVKLRGNSIFYLLIDGVFNYFLTAKGVLKYLIMHIKKDDK